MQTHSSEEYKDFTDYSQQVNNAIGAIKTCTLLKETKQMGSFKVTLGSLKSIMNDMKEIRRLLDNISKLPVMDLEAKKDNKNAQKVAKIISDIKKRLRNRYKKASEEFLKQFKVARKQFQNAVQSLEKDDKTRITNASVKFRLMAEEAKMSPFKIPFNKQDEMSKHVISQAIQQHEQNSKQLDNTMNDIDNTSELAEAIQRLSELLVQAPQDKNTNAIRKEFMGIKRAKPPKMIAVAKSTLDSLRHSQQLSLDIEDINQIMGANSRFLGNDKQLQRVAEQIQDLNSLLKKAKESEDKRYEVLKEINGISYGIVKEATEATQEYINALAPGGTKELPIRYVNIREKLKKQSRLLAKKQKENKGVTR